MRCPTCQNDVPPGLQVCDFCGSPLLLPPDALLPGGTAPGAPRRTTFAPPRPDLDAPTEPPRPSPFPTGPVAPPRPAFDPNDPLKPTRGASPAGTAVEGRQVPRMRGAVIERRADESGRIHALKEGRNKLGRDGGCDVVVADSRASADHGYFFVKPDGTATYHDVSRNGTLVDGRPVHGDVVAIQHGSALQIGTVRLYVLLLPPGTA